MIKPPLLIRALREPQLMQRLDLREWDLLVRQARRANLLASLHSVLEETGWLENVPAEALRHLAWSRAVSEKHREAVRWEVGKIRAALAPTGVPVILLKGAAYVMAGLPSSRGRLFSDVDIIVPKPRIGEVEAALMMGGWIATHHDAYDQRYYRQWMHEIPPMQHMSRMSVIDVHHAILPETAQLHPSPAKLQAASVPLAGFDDLRVFCPTDMVLHSAVHLFHDGELEQGLRDLFDLHRLFAHFGETPGFWPALTDRAVELGLQRPLYYALRYADGLLGSPVPVSAMRAAKVGAPPRWLRLLMDALFRRALLPAHESCSDWFSGIARHLLYVRANWLRMPPLMLGRHLFHKAFLSEQKA
jgi:hypothetical protein